MTETVPPVRLLTWWQEELWRNNEFKTQYPLRAIETYISYSRHSTRCTGKFIHSMVKDEPEKFKKCNR